jgi:hypothetical protein
MGQRCRMMRARFEIDVIAASYTITPFLQIPRVVVPAGMTDVIYSRSTR